MKAYRTAYVLQTVVFNASLNYSSAGLTEEVLSGFR